MTQKMRRVRPSSLALCLFTLLIPQLAHAAELTVTSVSPPPNGLNAAVGAPIVVHFNLPVDRKTVTDSTFWAFGRGSGAVPATFTFADDDQTVILTPAHQFTHGEQVMVILSHDLHAADARHSPLRPAGHSWQFITRANPAPMTFTQIDSISTRAFPTEAVRSYGGIATDLNNDGWLDLTLVNEDSEDLRVFMNNADGTGSLADFIQPTNPVGDRASPSEPADFNRDGFADICVANIDAATVSILLGNGDGTYAPQQLINVGSSPRGIAVLDADGDGDIDIANTNFGSSNLSIMLNDGAGVFGSPTFFEGGAVGEWALVAADMNEDGILDLVVGARTALRIVVVRGNGNGTFTPISLQNSGGSVWMINAADLNGDGHNDVAAANSQTNSGAVLLGTGAGTLGLPTTIPVDPFPLATDLGDLDGDGDLDWALSSFNGDWRFYKNNGLGGFTFNQEINAPAAASCALMFDTDNDGDLDLGLIDEIEDVILLQRNGGIALVGDINLNNIVDVDDLLSVINAWGPCDTGAICPADINGDDVVDTDDLLSVINHWTP